MTSSSHVDDIGGGDGAFCEHCGKPRYRGHRHQSRTCPGYAPLWAGDQNRRFWSNLLHYGDTIPDRFEARVALVTITAPGADQLPWDTRYCEPDPLGGRVQTNVFDALGGLIREVEQHRPHRHSGDKGCAVEYKAARAWNEWAPHEWTRLNRAAMTAVARLGFKSPLLAYVWEFQKRGVLHLHCVCAFSTPEELAATRAYQAELVRLASAYLFGRVDSEERPRTVARAADYLSRYLVRGGRGSKPTIQETVTRADAPTLVAYVAPRLTKATGVTMGFLRSKRRAFQELRSVLRATNGELERTAMWALVEWFTSIWGLDPVSVEAAAFLPRGP